MGLCLFPHDRIENVFKVDFKALEAEGIKAAFFDIDNTLVGHDAPGDDRAAKLVRMIQSSGIKAYLISNNGEERVRSFKEAVGADGYVFKAGKPLTKGFRKALTELSLDKSQAVFFGDQIFTDAWGGRNAGVFTVLTKPLYKKEPPHIILKRALEAPVLLAFKIKYKISGPARSVPLKDKE